MLIKTKTKSAVTFFFGITMCLFQSAFAGDPVHKSQKNNPDKPFQLPAGLSSSDYVSNAIIFKLKPEYRSRINDAKLAAVFSELQTGDVGKIYSNQKPPLNLKNAHGVAPVDLSLIYEFHYNSGLSLEQAINKVIATGMVQYAEPRYIQYEHAVKLNIQDIVNALPPFNPNDPDITNYASNMYYISRIKCPDAWGINTTTARGDSSTVIGIVDSGTDIDHPDLKTKIRYNYKDPINGTDDDGDGYVDNFRGWDISENDNNPNVDNSNHGSHVSGCAAAATNNNIGVASPGFNCTFLPVKCAKKTSTTQIDNGYEGIKYAADHGCQIINCSWGGAGGGQYAQDIIAYATLDKGALVVASAGNANNEKPNFPGSFDLALCVASTTSTDAKSSFSTYGHTIDVSSPGSGIRSTVSDNSYTNMDGTSMASPICAGAAAIVKTFFPNYTGLQVGEQLRVTADDIYNLSANTSFKEKLGSGRINLYRALSETPTSVRMRPVKISDNDDEVFVINDTLYITGTIVNYLKATTNLTATLSTTSTNVTIVTSTLSPGAMATLGTFTVNNGNAYKVFIKPGTPVNAVIPFKITFQDGSYTDYQYIDLTVNVDYVNIAINDVASTNTSRGRIGWNNSDGTGGLGFAYKDSAMLYEAGLMIGVSSSKVSDNVRGSNSASNDLDFVSVQTVKEITPVKSEFETAGIFDDNGATSKIGVQVRHKSFAWTTAGDRKYIIFEYFIKNISGATLNNLYAGIFADWDITDKTSGQNKGDTDQGNKLGYTYSTVGTQLYGGIRLLTKGPFLHYVIDNVSGGGGGVDISDQTNRYSTSEKYTTLSTNRLKGGATAPSGNDVADVVSTGPFTMAANDSIVVAFALLAGDDLNDLIASSQNAQIKYDGTVTSIDVAKKPAFALKQNYPNPVNASKTVIEFTLPESAQAELNVYNTLGQKVSTVFNTSLTAGTHIWNMDVSGFENGIYFYELKASDQIAVMKMSIQK